MTKKINQRDKAKIGLVSPKQILQWGERFLPVSKSTLQEQDIKEGLLVDSTKTLRSESIWAFEKTTEQ